MHWFHAAVPDFPPSAAWRRLSRDSLNPGASPTRLGCQQLGTSKFCFPVDVNVNALALHNAPSTTRTRRRTLPALLAHTPIANQPLCTVAMSGVANLSKSLPKPKYAGDEEQLPSHSTRLFNTEQSLSATGPPPYGSRTGWRPRTAADFADGGAFPECAVAQYPLDMGRKATSSSTALQLRVDKDGKSDVASQIAQRGHGASRIVQSSFKDLIPLRQLANAGELDLSRPSAEEVEATRVRTAAALGQLITTQTAAQNPKNFKKRR